MAYASAYDQWLEAPYVRAAAEEADYHAFCEANDLDPDTAEAEVAFQAAAPDEYDPEADFGPCPEEWDRS